MPTVTIYIKSHSLLRTVEPHLTRIRFIAAQLLSSESQKTYPEEVSVRVIEMGASLTVSEVEVEMQAFINPHRSAARDMICRQMADYLDSLSLKIIRPHVWLALSEVGYSGNP
jgi:hypothetical protein